MCRWQRRLEKSAAASCREAQTTGATLCESKWSSCTPLPQSVHHLLRRQYFRNDSYLCRSFVPPEGVRECGPVEPLVRRYIGSVDPARPLRFSPILAAQQLGVRPVILNGRLQYQHQVEIVGQSTNRILLILYRDQSKQTIRRFAISCIGMV